jgi:hypothetical protein
MSENVIAACTGLLRFLPMPDQTQICLLPLALQLLPWLGN